MQSLGALAHISYQEPGVCGYELAAMYMKEIGISYKEIEQFYRRMVLPAYDITFSYNPTNKWLRAHQMTVNGKTTEIGLSDLLEAGAKMGIKERRCKDIISEIGTVVGDFATYAEQVGIKEKTCEYINSVIAANIV